MSRSLNLAVTAVGVETAEQLEFPAPPWLHRGGRNFLSPALPPEEVIRLLYSNVNLLTSIGGDVTCQ